MLHFACGIIVWNKTLLVRVLNLQINNPLWMVKANLERRKQALQPAACLIVVRATGIDYDSIVLLIS